MEVRGLKPILLSQQAFVQPLLDSVLKLQKSSDLDAIALGVMPYMLWCLIGVRIQERHITEVSPR